ncbi:MAG: DUF721 domain-containing protein [Muribaculaceae bacterium]|nr:DUF721 domain-containing protein [Muribaculaceae bacterium]MDE6027937.1 DUF721 domain-containing protein [Muribaculaceae bacterium]
MKRTEPESIGDVLRLTIQESNMTGRLDECRAIEIWPQVIGETLARRMSRPSVSNGVMVVYVDSAALRHELTMHRSRLIEGINSHLGKEVIKSLRFK